MTTMKGIDVSAYQSNIDFNKVKRAGIEVAYIKATEGISYTNPYLRKHAVVAKAAGVKVGFYHFFRARSVANAVQQAQHFVNAISGLSYDCKLALDIETTESLGKSALNSYAKAFLDRVALLIGKTPVLYSYTSFINSYLTSALNSYPLWVADYRSGSPASNSVWGSRWIGWQYSSTGTVSGISGQVDLDVFTNEILITGRDVNKVSDWAAASWKKACNLGLFDGTEPGSPLTREMAAVILDRLSLLDHDTYTPNLLPKAKEAGLIVDDHDLTDPADVGFVLQTELNLKGAE